MAKFDRYGYFREFTKEQQREHLLSIAALCIDAAPTTLARKIEIYLDATPEEQKRRLDEAFE